MTYDIVGIGNPLLDSTTKVDEAFLERHGLRKGGMTLVTEEQQERITEDLEVRDITNTPGGSVANTLAAARALGGRTAFIGSIGDDEHGDIYEELITSIGITSGLIRSATKQGKCLVLITPDGERTFATFLGASLDLNKEAIDESIIAQAKVLYIEGYQLDGKENTAALMHALQLAKEHHVRVSIDFADVGVVERHHDALQRIINDYADIIFANKTEATAYTGEQDEEQAARRLAQDGRIAVVKRGNAGSIIAHEGKTDVIKGYGVTIVNANGAGDAYAGAFLQSILQGKEVRAAGTIASFVAAQAVAQEGAMLERDLKEETRNLFR